MHIIKDQSVFETFRVNGDVISITNKKFKGWHRGINKAGEYSWFYLLCLRGKPGEKISIEINLTPDKPNNLALKNGLVFHSPDGWRWQKLAGNALTDLSGLKQKYTFTFTSTHPVYISNTILYNYKKYQLWLNEFLSGNRHICALKNIGKSFLGNNLQIISFNQAKKPRGRILVTTGCHPAEPDLLASMKILEYLKSNPAKTLREQYIIDIMPMQNPDGYVLPNCLTANGINLYWNFRPRDKANCPEASHLWQYIKKHPPILYLDFHAYVHQSNRVPCPYLQSPAVYRGALPKKTAKRIDRFLIKASNRYFRLGSLTMWPNALSTRITRRFNTLAFTKYHLQIHEGLDKSRARALNIFKGATNIILFNSIDQQSILTQPHGLAKPDYTDRQLMNIYYSLINKIKQIYITILFYIRDVRYYKKLTGLLK